MKKLIVLFFALSFCAVQGQTINASYVKALYAKYPVVKNNLCANCYLWVNPYYKSIADVKKNYPVCEHAIVTAADVAAQEKANIQRSAPKKGTKLPAGTPPYISALSGWNVVTGGTKLDAIYKYANSTLKKPVEFAYGHCGLAWILAARDPNGAIFSDTETYGEFMEWQVQNVGTMIGTEDTTRLLLGATLNQVKHKPVVDHVDIWAGCVSSDASTVYTSTATYTSKSFADKKITETAVTVPDIVWKIIKIGNNYICYWMPNTNTEVKALLPKRHIKYADLVARLHFDPVKTL